jgi:hypothetical protein
MRKANREIKDKVAVLAVIVEAPAEKWSVLDRIMDLYGGQDP